MKKNKIIPAACLCACLLAGCTAAPASTASSAVSSAAASETASETTNAASESMPESEEASVRITIHQQSDLGYTVDYDPAAFTLSEADGVETYQYNSEEVLNGPITVSFRASEKDAESVANELLQQTQREDVTIQDTFFGAESAIEAKCVYLEKEGDGKTDVEVYYAVPTDTGSLIVEIHSFIGAPMEADGAVEELLGTFTLNTAE